MDLAQQLEREEGRQRAAYRDSLGYLTIGVGRLIDAKKGGGLSDAEIDMLLANDIAQKTAEVSAALPGLINLEDARQAVLIGMAFQMGTAGLMQFKRMLAAVGACRFDAAAQAMLDSAWAKQTPARAQRLAKQMQTGEWQA